tara:strand:+ start:330 stop:581 length:252 start_codon:yes stop_codon:yes gene_type:complete
MGNLFKMPKAPEMPKAVTEAQEERDAMADTKRKTELKKVASRAKTLRRNRRMLLNPEGSYIGAGPTLTDTVSVRDPYETIRKV